MPNAAKQFRDFRYRVFYGLFLTRGFELATLCAEGSICPWTIHPDGLNSNSVVYSGGVGSDISFEHELVKRFGCDVILCDPAPAGKRTMQLPENTIPQFHFFPVALAGHTGHLNLSPPAEPGGDSYYASAKGDSSIEVPCTNLRDLMRKNNHNKIDFLKLDIEGAEYDIISEILEHRIPVRQICVEFHHGLVPGIKRRQSIGAMLKLIRRGYKMLCQEGANHTFFRP